MVFAAPAAQTPWKAIAYSGMFGMKQGDHVAAADATGEASRQRR